MQKIELRHIQKQQRHAISPQQRASAAEAAAQHLLASALFAESQHIACYYPIHSEFNTLPIIRSIWQRKKTCYLPVLEHNELNFAPYQATDTLKTNQFNIPEPCTNSFINPENLDIVLLPLLAFDHDGHRLGTGGGYYDKFCSKLSKTIPALIGVGFESQHVTQIPQDPWDLTLSYVLTEHGLYQII